MWVTERSRHSLFRLLFRPLLEYCEGISDCYPLSRLPGLRLQIHPQLELQKPTSAPNTMMGAVYRQTWPVIVRRAERTCGSFCPLSWSMLTI